MTFAKLSTLSGYAYQLRRDECNSLAFFIRLFYGG